MAEQKQNYLVAIHEGLNTSLEKQVAALPKNFNKQRFLQNCMTVLQDGSADFSKCEPKTVVRTLLKGAFLGLDSCQTVFYRITSKFLNHICPKFINRTQNNIHYISHRTSMSTIN